MYCWPSLLPPILIATDGSVSQVLAMLVSSATHKTPLLLERGAKDSNRWMSAGQEVSTAPLTLAASSGDEASKEKGHICVVAQPWLLQVRSTRHVLACHADHEAYMLLLPRQAAECNDVCAGRLKTFCLCEGVKLTLLLSLRHTPAILPGG